jgi:hypothetical protein
MRCPAGRLCNAGTRAALGLRPGPLRGPARSWLTTVRSTQTLSVNLVRRGPEAGHLRRKRGPVSDKSPQVFMLALSLRYMSAHGAPRGARASS